MKKILISLMSLLITCMMIYAGDPPSGLSTNGFNGQVVPCTSFNAGSGNFNFGTPPYVGRGVVYGTSSNPTISGPKVVAPAPITNLAFSVTLSGLTPGTHYYYRSYATNYYGTAYGNQLEITMQTPNVAPSGLSTSNGWPVYCNGFDIGSTAFYTGCTTITDCGVCWSTSASPAPTPENSSHQHVTNPNGLAFNVSVTSLTTNTKYYYRTWATNSYGRAYGPLKNVTTCPACSGVCYP